MNRPFGFFLVVIVLVTVLTGCGNLGCFQVRGPITQWTYHISPFSKIRVYNSPQIYITQGDTQSVMVESEENMFHALLFHIDPFKELLYIDFDETCIDDIDHFKIFITIDTLKGIDLRAGGEVWVEDVMKTDTLDISISGSAEVHIHDLNANAIRTSISGSGDVILMGSDTLNSQTIDVTGIGSIFSFALPTKNCSISVSGGAIIQTTVLNSLNVAISGTGDVFYKGNPNIETSITGTGTVVDSN